MTETNNELNWKGYEQITSYIYQTLGAGYGIKVIGHGKDCKVKGKSGVEHQIDVLTQHVDGQGKHLTAIECKFLKKKITKEIVMKLKGEMDDADIESGIIVCKSGFTKDTRVYAEHVGIKLVELRETGESDGNPQIDIGTLDIHINAILTRPMITAIDLGSAQLTDEKQLMALRYPGNAFIVTPEGHKIDFERYVNAYCVALAKKEQLLKTIAMTCPLVKGKLVSRFNTQEIEIEKMVFTGVLMEFDESTKKSFQLVDQTWMVMKEIFGNNTFKLSKNGLIVQSGKESGTKQ